ncbi:MAG: hypothetical protein NW237_15230 [Cyanobacteriota bacterium]|nr:hypothetical protein [Cyanobacteriota bacterium]
MRFPYQFDYLEESLVELGLSQRELSDLTQKSVQFILSGREGESEALTQYKASAEFRAGVQLACAAMVLVLAENNSRITEQLQASGILK